jgi:hypothetical protein
MRDEKRKGGGTKMHVKNRMGRGWARTMTTIGGLAVLMSLACHESNINEGTTTWVGTGETGAYEPPDPFPTSPFTFHISETTNFNQSGVGPLCINTDLNQVGALLRDEMLADNWTGEYLLNTQTDVRTFREATLPNSNGQDDQFADNRRFSLYAGHGGPGLIQWGTPPQGANNDCWNIMPQHLRLGHQAGGASGFGMWVTSCTANVNNDQILFNLARVSTDPNDGPINLHSQQLGWHNSPAVEDKMPREFFLATGTMVCDQGTCAGISNRQAFMGMGQTRPGVGWNSPVVFSQATILHELNERHFDARLREGTGIDVEIEQPQEAFRYTMVDNGDCP